MRNDGRLIAPGFSLVELMVAILVGAIFILTANIAVDNYVHTSQRGTALVLANSFAEGKVEQLRNIGYNGLDLGTTDISSELPAGLHSPKSASMQITSPSAGIKQIDISLSYNQDGPQTYSYTTYIGELGVGQ